ncbi:MAG: hypothetical protein AAFZ65_05350, partial [Planctomycetota bacterium]
VARYGFGARSEKVGALGFGLRTWIDEVEFHDLSGVFSPDLDADGTLDACQGGAQEVRLGTPPNVDALRFGSSVGPMLSATYRPWIDHSGFLPGAELDFLSISLEQTNLPLAPYGTALGGFNPISSLTQAAGTTFDIALPPVSDLLGLELTFTGASVDYDLPIPFGSLTVLLLTNAIDATITGWQAE